MAPLPPPTQSKLAGTLTWLKRDGFEPIWEPVEAVIHLFETPYPAPKEPFLFWRAVAEIPADLRYGREEANVNQDTAIIQVDFADGRRAYANLFQLRAAEDSADLPYTVVALTSRLAIGRGELRPAGTSV